MFVLKFYFKYLKTILKHKIMPFKNILSVLPVGSEFAVAIDGQATGESFPTPEATQDRINAIKLERKNEKLLFDQCKPAIRQYMKDHPGVFRNTALAYHEYNVNVQFRLQIQKTTTDGKAN